jgi:hypothetical protein
MDSRALLQRQCALDSVIARQSAPGCKRAVEIRVGVFRPTAACQLSYSARSAGNTGTFHCSRSAAALPSSCGAMGASGYIPAIASSSLGNAWSRLAHWDRIGRLASLLGSLKIASRGGQNHIVDRDALAAIYHKHYGHHLW